MINKIELTEEKIARVMQLRPIDDVMFEVLADDKAFCQEMLQTILQDKDLQVNDVIVQSSKRNLFGKSVRLDALCTLGSGEQCNIEVQRSDDDNHLKRARYNASLIISKCMEPGEKYENVPTVTVVYISEHDFLRGGKTIYHVEQVIKETGEPVNDGYKVIFVNTAVDDGTEIADLMRCMLQREVNNAKFPVFTNRMAYMKDIQGGLQAVCKVMEEYAAEEREKGRKEGWQKGRQEGRQEGEAIAKEKAIQKLMQVQKLTREQAESILL